MLAARTQTNAFGILTNPNIHICIFPPGLLGCGLGNTETLYRPYGSGVLIVSFISQTY